MIETLLSVWHGLTDPDQLILLLSGILSGGWGYALLAAIVFAETGLLVGLFLPGDSLLFTVGVVCGAGQLDIVQVCAILAIAAIVRIRGSSGRNTSGERRSSTTATAARP
jgi:membrane-associated protein